MLTKAEYKKLCEEIDELAYADGDMVIKVEDMWVLLDKYVAPDKADQNA